MRGRAWVGRGDAAGLGSGLDADEEEIDDLESGAEDLDADLLVLLHPFPRFLVAFPALELHVSRAVKELQDFRHYALRIFLSANAE